MVVEFVTIEFAEIARFADTQDHRFQEPGEFAPAICCGDTSSKFHGPIARFTGSTQRVLADTLFAAQHERVIDLLPTAAAPAAPAT